MILVVDGIAFQLGHGAIVRLWQSLLHDLQYKKDLKIIALDRGNFPKLDNVFTIPFPSYTHTMTANDSILIQKICDLYKADMFVSTYYTSPLTTPSVLNLYDMSSEIFQFDSDYRIWREKTVAITCAQRYICISKGTKDDLLNSHPTIDASKVIYSYYRTDIGDFYCNNSTNLHLFSNNRAEKSYILINELIINQKSPIFYKKFFEAISHFKNFDFDIICCNSGLQQISKVKGLFETDINIKFVTCSNKELGDYYRGAFALLCHAPSEDYAISIIEAMACGCPIISSDAKYISEICGDAAFYLSDVSSKEIEIAIHRLNDEKTRSSMRNSGLIQAHKFRNADLSDALMSSLNSGLIASQSESNIEFRSIFSSLRIIQSDVDTGIFVE